MSEPTNELADPTAAQVHFLRALPRIRLHAQLQFRNLTPEAKDDAIAKAIGLAWKAYAREVEKGRDPDTYISAIAGYAVKQVKSDRDVTGQEKAKDVLSKYAQKKKRFTVQVFPEYDCSPDENESLDALHDHRESPPDEAASFRHDFPMLVEQLPEKQAAVVLDAALGDTTTELAEKHKVSLSRVSQIRTEAKKKWAELATPPAERER
jgi:DNA-directed RNA polymerase specialized sigma24 family protein